MMIQKLRYQFIAVATVAILILQIVLVGGIWIGINSMVQAYVDNSLDSFAGSRDQQNFITEHFIGPLNTIDALYYSITVDDKNRVLEFDDTHNPQALTSDSAQVLADRVHREGENSGRFSYNSKRYAYICLSSKGGKNSTILVMDYTSVSTWVRQIRRVILLIGFASFVLFEILIIALSGRMIRPAVRNAENQKRFITNASHELKTPVAIISANNEVLEAINGSNEWTQSITNQVSRLNSLISALVQLTKSGEGSRPAVTRVDLSAVTDECAEAFRAIFENQGITLEKNIIAGMEVMGDRNVLSEIVNILLDNASKYCDEGGTVKASVRKIGILYVQLEVSNDYKEGRNIDYTKFFERFYREDQSHNSEKKGFGIGLSMADELVRGLGGNIHAEWHDGAISFIVHFSAALKKNTSRSTEKTPDE